MKTQVNVMIIVLLATVVAFLVSFPQARADGDVLILSHTLFQDEGFPPISWEKGNYHVAGEVQNVGTKALHFNITAEFYNSNNEVVGTAVLSDSGAGVAPSYLHVLLPGKKSPFDIALSLYEEHSGDFRNVDHYSLKVTTSPASLFDSGFEIFSQSSHEAGDTIFIEGEIKNIGTKYIDGIMVFATFYNETGDVVAVSSESAPFMYVEADTGESGFSPNQTTYFSVKLEDFLYGGRLQRVAKYELTAEGYDYSLWTDDGQLISSEIVYVLGSLPRQEEDKSGQPEGSPITLYAAITAIAVILLAATYLVLRKRKSGKRKARNQY